MKDDAESRFIEWVYDFDEWLSRNSLKIFILLLIELLVIVIAAEIEYGKDKNESVPQIQIHPSDLR